VTLVFFVASDLRALRVLRGFLIVPFVAAALLAQQTAPPVFRSGVEAVQVDVYVTDANGNPVSGLTADDFEVLENGKRQTITTFAPVDIPVERAERLPFEAEPDVQTNNRPQGHVYLFILAGVGTDEDMSPALRARYLMRRFLDEHFGDNDIGAIITGRTFPGDRQDFTSNRRLLLTAVDRFNGEALDREELTDLMEMMARVPGGRKVVVWFVDKVHLAIDPFALVDYHGGVLSIGAEEAHAAMAAAARANIRFYLVDPEGLTTSFGGLELQSNYRMLAEMTGGFATVGTNTFDAAFERIVRETSTYYVLGFNSVDQQRTGRYVQLQVNVKRPGLTVRSRTGYLEQMRYSRKRTLPVPPKSDSERTPAEAALANPLATDGVGMRVFAAPYRNATGTATVALVTELDASSIAFTQKNGAFSANLEIRHLATDVNHKIYPEYQHKTAISLDARNHQRVAAGGFRVVSEFEVPKGRYQVRVASASGERNGSVVYDVEVPDFGDGPLSLSGVSLAALSPTDTVTLRPGKNKRSAQKSGQCRYQSCGATVILESTLASWQSATAPSDTLLLRDRLPAPPTASREFDTSDTLALYTEVYDNNSRVQKDPPYTIALAATLFDAEGHAVREASDERDARAPRRPAGGHGFTLKLPLAGLSRGSYVLRVQARSGRDGTYAERRGIPIRVK
jgi:VWFA-related protein